MKRLYTLPFVLLGVLAGFIVTLLIHLVEMGGGEGFSYFPISRLSRSACRAARSASASAIRHTATCAAALVR